MKQRLRAMGKQIWTDVVNCRVAAAVLAVWFLAGRYFLYSLCPLVVITGFPCPVCGMTRAVFALLRGDFGTAWTIHPFSYGIVALALLFALRRYVLGKDVKCLTWPAVILFAGMILFYIYRMAVCFPDEPPMTYYYGSVLYRALMFL